MVLFTLFVLKMRYLGGINSQQETKVHVFLYDGVHPNNAGTDLEGAAIASKFKRFFG